MAAQERVWLPPSMRSPTTLAVLGSFVARAPRYQSTQEESLQWLAHAHTEAALRSGEIAEAAAQKFAGSIRKLIERCGCAPGQIVTRGHELFDFRHNRWGEMEIYDLSQHPRGRGTLQRTRCFARSVDAYFRETYADEQRMPRDLLHVTCTGYTSPSGAQKLAAERGSATRVLHMYHMGCYAAVPAIRTAGALLAQQAAISGSEAAADGVQAEGRVDIVHTEMCTLHLDPGVHTAEQLVIQSLFADGFIRYSVQSEPCENGLEVLAAHEALVPDTAESMRWEGGDAGMQMTLARDVPGVIADGVRRFLEGLYRQAGLSFGEHRGSSRFAIHPGGPRIVAEIQRALELTDEQTEESKKVLREHGNMSSATLPHVWMNLAHSSEVPRDTLIASLAFGPGLTIAGSLLRKL